MNTKDSLDYCPTSCCEEEHLFIDKICYFQEADQCGSACNDNSDCGGGTLGAGVCCYLPCNSVSIV